MSPALADEFSTTESPGKSPSFFLLRTFPCRVACRGCVTLSQEAGAGLYGPLRSPSSLELLLQPENHQPENHQHRESALGAKVQNRGSLHTQNLHPLLPRNQHAESSRNSSASPFLAHPQPGFQPAVLGRGWTPLWGRRL